MVLPDQNPGQSRLSSIVMELDTGASVSIISKAKFRVLFPREPLEPTDVGKATVKVVGHLDGSH